VDSVPQNPLTVQCQVLTDSGQKLEEFGAYSFTEPKESTV